MPDPNVPNDPFSHIVGFIESRRKQQRDLEDQELDRKIALTHDLIYGPGANPARTAQGLSDIMSMLEAKGGRGKTKGGASGFFSGEHQLPDPTLLSGIIHGSIPYEGPTQEAVPQPQSPAQQGLMPEASAKLPPLKGFDGQDVLNSPVMVPPEPLQAPPEASRMLDAARQMQAYNEGPKTRPVANQPAFKSHEEQIQESANDAALKTSTSLQANMKAEFDTLVKMGTDPKQAQLAVAEKYGLKAPQQMKAVAGSTKLYTYTGADGQPAKAYGTSYIMPDGTTQTRSQVTGMPLPPDSQAVQTGAGAASNKFFTDDKGDVTAVKPDFSTQLVGRIGKGYHAPQQQLYVYETPDKNNPGQNVPVAVPKTSLVPGKNSAVPPVAASDGTIAPPPKSQKLGTEEQSFVDTAQGIQKTMDRINKSIEDAGMQHMNSVSDWSSVQVQNWWRKQGFEPKQLQADLQQRVGYLRATLLRSLLGGRPNKYVTEIFQSHLPAEFQTPAQIYNTMKLVRQEINDRYTGISAGHGGQALPALGGNDNQQGGGDAEFKQFLDALKKK